MGDEWTTDDPAPMPEPPGELWSIFAVAGPFRGEWNGEVGGPAMEAFASREDAEEDAKASTEGVWRVAMIGVSPAWKAKALAAEAEARRWRGIAEGLERRWRASGSEV